MNNAITLKSYIIGILFTLLLLPTTIAQVGINTTTPSAGSLLDISSTEKGLLVPRVDIIDINTIAPVTGGSTESLLVYNTNTTTGKGFYYWSGSIWLNFTSDDWKEKGNSGTTAGVDFVGTTDNVALDFRTNNTQRFRISTNGHLRSFTDGTAANPIFTWDTDRDIGVFRAAANTLGFATTGIERFSLSDTEAVLNESSNDYNFRVETNDDANALFIDGANNNVGLGINNPNSSSQLELANTNKGLLINRVALLATNNASPVTSPATGLLVYNTASASSGDTEVLPGFYYWDGSIWIAMGGTNGRDWSLLGNASINPANNFLGTTQNTDFVLRTNNIERMRFLGSGNAAIGNTTPDTDITLRVNNLSNTFGIKGETSSNGAAVWGVEYDTGIGVVGENQGTGIGVYGYGLNNHGAYGITSYTGGSTLTGGVFGIGIGNNNANGVIAVTNNNATTQSNIGLRAISGSVTSISTSDILNIGLNTNATDLSLYGLTEGPITTIGELEAARFQTNYTGAADNTDTRDPRAQLAGYIPSLTISGQGNNRPMYYGGYFYSGGSTPTYAYAGAYFNSTSYKIIGTGTVSTIVEGATKDDSKKIMFAPEAPEVLFEDYGIGKLENGITQIPIDPIFAKNITVNKEHPLKVFIQLEGECNGVYVTDKSGTGFTVIELQNGNSNVSFSWHIIANRKDTEGNSYNKKSNFENLRFPDAPSEILQAKNRSTKIDNKDVRERTKLSSN